MQIKTLYGWDFPDKDLVPDGYDVKRVPRATDENFQVLVERVNELIEAFNELAGEQED